MADERENQNVDIPLPVPPKGITEETRGMFVAPMGAPTESTSSSDDQSSTQQVPRKVRRRMSPQHIKRLKRRRMRRRILIGVAIVAAIFAALTAWLGVSALKAKDSLEQAIPIAKTLQSDISAGNTEAVEQSIDAFTGYVDEAYKQTEMPVWSLASIMPVYDDDVEAVRTAVRGLHDIATQAMPGLTQIIELLHSDSINISDGTITLPDLTDATAQLKTADSVMQNVEQQLNAAPQPHITQISDALDQATTYVSQMADIFHNASVFAQLAPNMLAMDGQTRTYLILAETNSELRPTGGIPGSWGTMTVTNGKVDLHEFIAGSSIPWFDDPVVDLTAEERTLFTDKLGRVAVDVNFTPDFPRTGEIAKAMWEQYQQTSVDGVIAMDPIFLQSMLGVTGGVTLPDGRVMDGTNTAQFLLSDVYAEQAVVDQDEYFATAAAAAFEKIMSTMQNPAAYMSAFIDAVSGGHLTMWSANEDEQKPLADTPISGRLVTEASNPQVGVYFSDLTQSKMDWYLDREVSVEYQKEAANGAKQYTVHIKLTNTMTQDQVASIPQYVLGDQLEGITNGQIKTALFVYAPVSGRLVDWNMSDGSEFDGVTVHNGLTLGTKSILLSPGESYEVTCHVQSAPGVTTPITLRQTPLIKENE